MGTRNWDSSWLTKHNGNRIISYSVQQAMANGSPTPIINPQTGVNTASIITIAADGAVAQTFRAQGLTVQEICCGAPVGVQSTDPSTLVTQIVNNSQE